jgi:hypothetical protein
MHLPDPRNPRAMAGFHRMSAVLIFLMFSAFSEVAYSQATAPGLISCTSGVPRNTCELLSGVLETLQAFPASHDVQFVIADESAFGREKSRAADYVFAHVINKGHPDSLVPMLHSSFDDNIVFEVSADSLLQCPDRVVLSVHLFAETKSRRKESTSTSDPDMMGGYVMFIQGYLEGCFGARQVR